MFPLRSQRHQCLHYCCRLCHTGPRVRSAARQILLFSVETQLVVGIRVASQISWSTSFNAVLWECDGIDRIIYESKKPNALIWPGGDPDRFARVNLRRRGDDSIGGDSRDAACAELGGMERISGDLEYLIFKRWRCGQISRPCCQTPLKTARQVSNTRQT